LPSARHVGIPEAVSEEFLENRRDLLGTGRAPRSPPREDSIEDEVDARLECRAAGANRLVPLGEDRFAARRFPVRIRPTCIERNDFEEPVEHKRSRGVRPQHADPHAVSARAEFGVAAERLREDPDLVQPEIGGMPPDRGHVPMSKRFLWIQRPGGSAVHRGSVQFGYHAEPGTSMLFDGNRNRNRPSSSAEISAPRLASLEVDTLIYRALVRKIRALSMAIGFVLIGVEPTKEKEVYQKLLGLDQIVELYPLFGEYDLIAKVEADDYNKIGEIVVSGIRTIEGVRATKTLAKMSF